MKQWGAVGLIEGLMHVYSNFRTTNGYLDNLLLSRSRKALVSLRDSELNTLLLELKELRNSAQGLNEKVSIDVWNKISPFLR